MSAPEPPTATGRPPVDRAAALAAGPPGVPRTFVVWLVVGALVLGLGGIVLEWAFSSAGLNPAKSAPAPSDTAPPGSTAAFMGLVPVPPAAAPAFRLTDQDGRPFSLSAQAPKVVVLTFFDGSCDDICPVLARELEIADRGLGPLQGEVALVTVNTDPSATTPASLGPAVTTTGLAGLANWRMVTGPVQAMNPLWRAYGVSISVQHPSGAEYHTDVMYFLGPSGELRYRATPFDDQRPGAGPATLPAAQEERWGAGIAAYARRLATP